jgi:hypothetical protein
MKLVVFLLLLMVMANSVLLYSQNIGEIYELSTYNLVAGPRHGFSGEESRQWQLYRNISENYSSEIIEAEYFNTKSIIAKLYLYWILREQNWQKLTNIYEDLMNYKEFKLWFSPLQCIVYSEPVEIENIINFNYNEVQEDINDFSLDIVYFEFDNRYLEEYIEQLYNEIFTEYLKLPYLDNEL